MTTFICKCGKTFEKNNSAATTGNRMPDYGPDHECYGCPFVHELKTWDPTQGTNIVDNHECRGCKEKLFYGTEANCVDSKASTLHVKSLDFDFIQAMTDFYNTLDSVDPMEHAPQPGMDEAHGKLPFSFNFPQNLKGEAAKQKLIEQFFGPVNTGDSYSKMYVRKDVSGCGEQYSLYDKIRKAKEEAKAMAQGIKDNPEFTEAVPVDPVSLTKYQKGSRVYYARLYQEGVYRTFFYHESDPSDEIVCASIPPANTLEDAQSILDDYARRHDYEVYTQPTSEAGTPLKSDLSSDDTADAAGELDENEPSAQQEQDETPNSENGELDSENDSDESDNKPCDWKNASGADEENDPVPSIPKDVVVGERVSLRNSEFDDILDAADVSLNSLIRALRDKKQHDGELNIKVTVEDYITAFHFGGQVGGKINYSLKSVKISLDDNIEIKFDESGNPVIPYDRQHQLNFDEIQPGRVIPPTPITTTVDGNTGLVEKVHADGESEDESKQRLSPYDHNDCPFFGVDDDENAGCCFDTEDTDDSSFPGDVWSAVHMESCKRPEVLEAYRKNNPDEDGIPGETDYEGSEEMTDDVPPEQVDEKSEMCYETTCMFFDPDAPLNCAFNADESFYGAPDGYETDKGDLFYSVEDLNCHKPELLAEYNKIKENENNDEN